MNRELPDVQAGFRKGKETTDQIANIHWITEKSKRIQKKKPSSASLTMLKPLCGSQQTVENSSRDGDNRPPYLPPEKSCTHLKKQQLESDMEQWTGSKLGKECINAVYCHLAYLTLMHSTSCEMLDWRKHKLESRLPGEISIISGVQMTPPSWKKAKRN